MPDTNPHAQDRHTKALRTMEEQVRQAMDDLMQSCHWMLAQSNVAQASMDPHRITRCTARMREALDTLKATNTALHRIATFYA